MDQRKPNRLRNYDYSQNGYYFVTICTRNGLEWFGKISDGVMELNRNGEIVSACWNDLPNHYRNIGLDEFIVMPNHVHGIIIIENDNVGNGLKPFRTATNVANDVGNGLKPFPTAMGGKTHGLSEIVRGFKTFSSRRINETLKTGDKFHWQKSFYDHVIRNDGTLCLIREYICNNPIRRDNDRD